MKAYPEDQPEGITLDKDERFSMLDDATSPAALHLRPSPGSQIEKNFNSGRKFRGSQVVDDIERRFHITCTTVQVEVKGCDATICTGWVSIHTLRLNDFLH